MHLAELRTPAAIVDLDVVERNTRRMAERVSRLGGRLRPHVKTHKCIEAARLQVRGHFGGITVSTLAEARFFADAGFRDITYAFPLPIPRIADTVELGRTIDRLNVLLDHERTLCELERCASAKGVRVPAFLKVDSGYHRAGVDPTREESVALARRVATSEHLDFRGILTHAGHSYHSRHRDDAARIARQEREVVVAFADRLRHAGVTVPEVSLGSTPTLCAAENLSGVTEARPGNYVYFDRFQSAIGSCRIEDVAFSVLVTVVGHYPDHNKLIVDGGNLAFSMDPGPTHLDPRCGHGTFYSADGERAFPELRLFTMSQEHGQVTADRPIDFDAVPLGGQLRVLPNHSCLSSALYDRYHVLRGSAVVDEWYPVRGW